MGVASRIAKNTAFLGLAQVANKIITFVFLLFAMRFLGAAGFGKYSVVFAVFYILNTVADLGLGPLTVREVSKNKKLADKYLTNVLVLRLAVTSAMAAVAFVAVPWLKLPADTTAALRIVVVSLVIYWAAYAFGDLFTAHERMEYVALILVTVNVFTSAVGVLALVNGFRLVSIAVIWLAGAVLQLALASGLVLKVLFRPRWRFDPVFMRQMLAQAWPFMLSSVVLMAFWRADILILSWLRGDVQVGWYSGAYRFLDAILFIPQAFLGAVYPALSQLHGADEEGFRRLCRKCCLYLLAVGMPIAAGTTILAPQLVPLLVRNAGFNRAVPALQVLIWAFVTLSVRSVFTSALNAAGRQKTNFYVDGIGMLSNVGLNLALIPLFGYMAAAGVTVGTDVMVLVLIYWLYRRLVGGIGLVDVVWRVVVSTAAMAAVVWVLRGTILVVPVLAGVAAYVVVAAALKVIKAEDIDFLRQLARRRPSAEMII